MQKSGLSCYRYGFISRSGFEAEPEEDLELICLDRLYRQAAGGEEKE